MLRILNIMGNSMTYGGIEALVMNYYRNIDRSKIQYDFLIHGYQPGLYDNEIRALGGRIYNIPMKSQDYLKNRSEIRNLLAEHEYKIIHTHMDAMGMPILKEAKRAGIPVRIAHSHNTEFVFSSLMGKLIKYPLNVFARKAITKYANYYFACSDKAGEWLFSDKVSEGIIKIVHNAVDANKFGFDPKVRNTVRKQLGIEEKFVIGNVGRLHYQKNQLFLLDIFHSIYKANRDAFLILIGEGELKEKLILKAKRLNIEESILFFGTTNRVQDYLQAMDMVIAPSIFEGLPLTIVEAQAAGLKCLVSDSITKQIGITNLVEFISLNKSPEYWGDFALRAKDYTRNNTYQQIKEANFDIKSEAIQLQNLYLSLI